MLGAVCVMLKMYRRGVHVGYYREYPRGLVDARGRYLGPCLECDKPGGFGRLPETRGDDDGTKARKPS